VLPINKNARQIVSGIFDNNPVLAQFLGLTPALAVTASLENALGMSAAVGLVLVVSNVIISALRKFVPQKIRAAAFLVLIAASVTAVDLMMQVYLPKLSGSLGIYVPLIAVNGIILTRAEAYASKNGVFRSLIDGVSMAAGFTLALAAVGVIREILGSGTVWGMPLFGDNFRPAAMMSLAPGGFLTLGVLIAAANRLKSRDRGGIAVVTK